MRRSNPNVPGQKLKCLVPKKADMENRCFVVSVPIAKVKEDDQEIKNKFPKAFKDSLYDYSAAYDDWCDAEGKLFLFLFLIVTACWPLEQDSLYGSNAYITRIEQENTMKVNQKQTKSHSNQPLRS